MSILLQYRRVFSTPRMRLACNMLIGFLAVYGTWTIVSAWANCVPLERFWDPTVPGFCFDKKALWFSNSAIHILTDILILIYPMPVLKSLQLPRRQRFALMAVFALGGLYVHPSLVLNFSCQIPSQWLTVRLQRLNHQCPPSEKSSRDFKLYRSNL